MKMTLITLLFTYLMAACPSDNAQEINPEMAKFDGKWKLMKVGYGFPPPNSPTEFVPTYEEILEFNSTNNTFTRTKDGKLTQSSSLKASSLADGGTSSRAIIIFEKENTYSFYSFTQNPVYLVLYQAAPVGAVLADGNNYFYQKIK
jgi:hypothetical protein